MLIQKMKQLSKQIQLSWVYNSALPQSSWAVAASIKLTCVPGSESVKLQKECKTVLKLMSHNMC